MSTAALAKAIAAARAARDAGIELVTAADRDGVDAAYLDELIDAFVATGQPFSANDLREHTTDVPQALIGARFQHASRNREVIRPVGRITSTKKNTHAKDLTRWVGSATQR